MRGAGGPAPAAPPPGRELACLYINLASHLRGGIASDAVSPFCVPAYGGGGGYAGGGYGGGGGGYGGGGYGGGGYGGGGSCEFGWDGDSNVPPAVLSLWKLQTAAVAAGATTEGAAAVAADVSKGLSR